MLRALRLRGRASEERERREITGQAEHAVEQTDIDQTTAAGDAALVERAENADRSEDAADQIAHRPTELGRHRARFAVDAHRAGQRLHDRQEEERGGKECVSTCRYRGSPSHEKKKQYRQKETKTTYK